MNIQKYKTSSKCIDQINVRNTKDKKYKRQEIQKTRNKNKKIEILKSK